MEDDLKKNGRQPQKKMKMEYNLIFFNMEDDLIFVWMEDDLQINAILTNNTV